MSSLSIITIKQPWLTRKKVCKSVAEDIARQQRLIAFNFYAA